MLPPRVQSAVHRSFAVADNLGEVSAKAQVLFLSFRNLLCRLFLTSDFLLVKFFQIQTVCFDNLGLLLAVLLNMLFQNNQRFIWVVSLCEIVLGSPPDFACCLCAKTAGKSTSCSVSDFLYNWSPWHLSRAQAYQSANVNQGSSLFVISVMIRAKQWRLLLCYTSFCLSFSYQNRLEIILERWIQTRQVPSPAEVSKEEGVDLLGSRGEKKNRTHLTIWRVSKSWIVFICCL